MADAPLFEVFCAICNLPVSLLASETCADDDGKTVHSSRYSACVVKAMSLHQTRDDTSTSY